MRTPEELFNLINSVAFNKVGDDVDYTLWCDNDDPYTTYLLFKQSDSKRDWANNLNFPVKLYNNQEYPIKVCKGWGNAWKSCNDYIMDELLSWLDEYKTTTLIIAGWSFGGAIAQLAAEDFYYRTGSKAFVITFGSPKPLFGSKTLKRFKESVVYSYNYANVNDCVPLMPPFPLYHDINRIKTGKKVLFGLFNPNKWHCLYGDKSQYENL